MTLPDSPPRRPLWQRSAETAMGLCLAVMAVAVFLNVVLRYGFGSGVAASEELSRLLFVWMVFIGAAAAYPAGEHMAFTGLVAMLRQRPEMAADGWKTLYTTVGVFAIVVATLTLAFVIACASAY